jgi:hypothetical protein
VHCTTKVDGKLDVDIDAQSDKIPHTSIPTTCTSTQAEMTSPSNKADDKCVITNLAIVSVSNSISEADESRCSVEPNQLQLDNLKTHSETTSDDDHHHGIEESIGSTDKLARDSLAPNNKAVSLSNNTASTKGTSTQAKGQVTERTAKERVRIGRMALVSL